MSFPRFFFALTMTIYLAGAGFAANPAAGPAEPQVPPLLPQQFAGWERQASPQISTDAAAADPTNAEVLKEYGFTDVAVATYIRDDGRTLKIRAARFADLLDIPAALAKATDGLHKIEFDSEPTVIYMDAAQVTAEPIPAGVTSTRCGILPAASGPS